MAFGKIKNAEELLSHGDTNSRRIVLEVTDEVLKRLDSYHRLRSFIRLEGSVLHIGRRRLDLDRYGRVYVFCAGKASNNMARAFEDILGDRMTQGVVIVKIKEATDVFARTEVYVGGHPLPNEGGIEGSKRILGIADQMKAEDLFLVAVTGYGQPGDVTAAKEAGFDMHVVKPLNMGQLQRLLASPHLMH